jgi:hypothetical protein
MGRELLQRIRTPQTGGPRLVGGSHGYVDIFENFAALNTAAAVGRFNQVIARLPTLFPPECVHKHDWLGKLGSLDQEACAVDVPCASRIHVVHPWGRESQLFLTVDRLTSNSCTPPYAKD